MKNLMKFNDYLTDKILENMNLKITELELILSPKLIKILKEINHKIADELLELHVSDESSFKLTFVDLGSEPDMVSFIQSNKVPELIEPEIIHGTYNREVDKETKSFKGGFFDYIPGYKNKWISDDKHIPDLFDPQFKSKDHPVWTKYRSEIKVGRFITKIFGNKFPANKKRDEINVGGKPNDVESFVNMYVATVESHSKIFKLVSGDDIKYWYDSDRYFKQQGTLGGSCMKSGGKSNYFDIYAKNPDKVQLLILHPEDNRDKIIGRAIVWKLDGPEGRYYMDRIYTADDSDEYMYIEYAKRHDWLYKASQTYGWDYNIIDPKTDKSSKISMTIQLNHIDYNRYPYVDTMQFFNTKTHMITNDRSIVDNDRSHWIHMVSTDGGYNNM